jgi:hypothetical protein
MFLYFLGGAGGSLASATAYDHFGWNGVVGLGAGLGLTALLFGWRIQAMESVNNTAARSG